jgi:hypothetical protein
MRGYEEDSGCAGGTREVVYIEVYTPGDTYIAPVTALVHHWIGALAYPEIIPALLFWICYSVDYNSRRETFVGSERREDGIACKDIQSLEAAANGVVRAVNNPSSG